MPQWIKTIPTDSIDKEDVARFDVGEVSLAIYRSDDNKYYATDGFCTHERTHLSQGLVMGNEIECPKHNGVFDYRTGMVKGGPVCINLRTYFVKVVDGVIYVDIDPNTA